ncbi:tRNA dihydrouridine synthase [Tuwongella immobilis]|uniref:tRNA-dihydrouridine synthase n=1 Tax=Tuwongella immobilis TaxID=692036 RepID=A0A6C2YPJ8_9BACT|nr:tRNA-dihydrouridine synthase family protein [Tuwongella immobilis]VIP03386.1 trna-dihydrouridine synthase c : tRNA-dihydrouridine synthase OS=Fimbriimonas ginsengisoli Gsoil 348 GN=OP10G_1493 PE=3 SV=1: Dus [Tuwongella immobilis]VTS04144.1 trna-dihydrouridine synthase c : tRNA-dihydrouridine synthase OS=Fimbriimonas ginsengisoli Gsoil 348 GN=OP10G_1493 PE=3 SV=1: Dus [Tuwongella immobilis]
MIRFGTPALVLAPMEGVTDAPMRALMGKIGAFDYAVSEFFRINWTVPQPKELLRHIPELRQSSRTPTNLPVQVQLLGGDPDRLAAAAVVAVQLGACGIDLNFGCPAKTVNRHDGGATLLKFPDRIRTIVRTVRDAVPLPIPVSAKMRLGWDTLDAIQINADRAIEGGASWITIHGRTRAAGYAPPIHWEPIGELRKRSPIPVIANGDIWTLDDFRRCRDITGCEHFMLGRGALANPHLPQAVAHELGTRSAPCPDSPVNWEFWLTQLQFWSEGSPRHPPQLMIRRFKQWLSLAAAHSDFAHFDIVKRAKSVEELLSALANPIAAASGMQSHPESATKSEFADLEPTCDCSTAGNPVTMWIDESVP